MRNRKKDIGLLDTGQEREIVKALQPKYPVTVICEVLAYPRSQVYYEPVTSAVVSSLSRIPRDR